MVGTGRLFGPQRGLFELQRRVLKVLVNNPLHDKDQNQNHVRHGLIPTEGEWSDEETDGDAGGGAIRAYFQADFDWDLERLPENKNWPRVPGFD